MASAAETRTAGDAAALQREAALHVATGAVALAIGAAVFGDALGQPLRTSLVALALFLPIGGLVVARVAAFHPFPVFGLPNAVTTGRAALTCLFGGALAHTDATIAVGQAWSLAALAGVCLALDGLDGLLARRLELSSPFGARFDMEVDSLLILFLALAAWALGKAGAWVLLSGLIRYGFVAAGWRWPALRAELPPSWRRKAVCVLQTAALCLVITPLVQPPVSTMIAAAALVALVGSFAVDTAWLLRRNATPEPAP